MKCLINVSNPLCAEEWLLSTLVCCDYVLSNRFGIRAQSLCLPVTAYEWGDRYTVGDMVSFQCDQGFFVAGRWKHPVLGTQISSAHTFMTCESYLPAWSNSFKEIPLKGIQGWFGQRRVTKYIFYDICVSERNSKRGQEMPECSCGATFHELMLVSLFVKSVRADFPRECVPPQKQL